MKLFTLLGFWVLLEINLYCAYLLMFGPGNSIWSLANQSNTFTCLQRSRESHDYSDVGAKQRYDV